MRLDVQQKMTALFFGILILLAFGAMAFSISAKPDDNEEFTLHALSTSTLSSVASPNGWWDSIPTDPSLPTMPGIGIATAIVTQTPMATPSQTNHQ